MRCNTRVCSRVRAATYDDSSLNARRLGCGPERAGVRRRPRPLRDVIDDQSPCSAPPTDTSAHRPREPPALHLEGQPPTPAPEPTARPTRDDQPREAGHDEHSVLNTTETDRSICQEQRCRHGLRSESPVTILEWERKDGELAASCLSTSLPPRPTSATSHLGTGGPSTEHLPPHRSQRHITGGDPLGRSAAGPPRPRGLATRNLNQPCAPARPR